MALTSSACPWKRFTGCSSPILHTKMDLSVEHVANELELRQSTSSVGAEWKWNCCITSPVLVSQTIAVLSTLPLSSSDPVRFHFSENTGPLCLLSVITSFPCSFQMRACPSYEPVASKLPSKFQSSVVTSLAFSLLAALKCSSTCHCMLRSASDPDSVVGMCQIRALESPDPDASSDLSGFHATVNTSDSCPDSVVTLLASISVPSSSIASAASSLSSACDCMCPGRSRDILSSVVSISVPSSLICCSISTYIMPFCTNEIRDPGGTSAPLMFALVTKLSFANVKAVCVYPDSSRYR
mmetsp:Transcript_14416/g.35251  ORF Transcript_14416/g.35251 Transcript_14416/m.35251 type:complete len:297 (-) Transcript_14416:64-954(-)